MGHAEPAMIAAGSALGGVLRLRGGELVPGGASAGALLEALLANGIVTECQHELLYRLMQAHSRLTRGYEPDYDMSLAPFETVQALALMVRLLEDLYGTPCGI